MDKDKYKELRNILREETSHWSMSSKVMEHPNYQKILDMGSEVVPLILTDLKNNNYDIGLFCLLGQLTNENPIPEKDRGKIEKIKNHWIKWGIKNGLID
tara:strand:- start:257 stop:553 length:297 start_codon:yes stop_codon:yes gene_type:complete